MNTVTFKDFFKRTYQSGSPVPFLITSKLAVFILMYFLDILFTLNLSSFNPFPAIVNTLSLPSDFSQFIRQPWSLLTYDIVYQGLFHILFQCLWLYWIGIIFLDFLKARQFLFVYFGGLLTGGLIYVIFGGIHLIEGEHFMNTGGNSLAAVLAATIVLLPRYELRLFLFGTVKLRFIGILYFAVEFLYYTLTDQIAAIAYISAILFGFGFTYALQAGMDWSKIFKKKKKAQFTIIKPSKTVERNYRSPVDLPNQEEIDHILDKISVSGYDNLSEKEKETLFKVSSNNKVDG